MTLSENLPHLTFLSRLAMRLQRISLLTGWRRYTMAFLAGLIAALSFAPVGFFPALWIGFPIAILLLRGTTGWRAPFAVGWWFAFGEFLLGLYWIADSMFVDIRQFWWAVPLAVAGLPAFLALYYGLAALIGRRIGFSGISGCLVFALLWLGADYLRGHLLSGFPWNLEGYAWIYVLPVLQISSVTGIYGLTLLTLVAACLPACLVSARRTDVRAVFLGVFLIVLIGLLGAFRLAEAGVGRSHDTKTMLRIVQPNTDQMHKWIFAEREGHFRKLLQLSAEPGIRNIDLVIWPETASPFYLGEDLYHRQMIGEALPANATVVTGVIRHDVSNMEDVKYYNSLAVVTHQNDIAGTYDKYHLVPFGEYVPFQNILPIRSLVSLGVNFSSGDGPHTLHIGDLPSFSPFICYEAVFPGDVVDASDRPAFLLNVTNDGWYGNTAGPYQHFAAARVRAIEEGMPLVRAANTGISGVVDSYGRVTASLPVGHDGFLDAALPETLAPTLFSRYDEAPLWLLFIAFGVLAFLLRVRPPTNA